MNKNIAPGARVVVRDAEWRVQRADMTADGGAALTCEGLSELVLGREAIFLTTLEDDIRVLQPEETALVSDTSRNYQASKLYLDTLLRQFVPMDEKIYVGHDAAMDQIPYQMDPARQALSQPRQRILIADSVGLGKTLSAGILTSELIARGRGKRILVLVTKAMLNQFQQEFFHRFTIPLVRLDSVGLQRVRNNIPANHNPFHYYDRSIISIDTLKQDAQYRHYLETAYWDIIIIDEAHNVAERSTRSQRARLAKLLSTRSDTLMMLSATPHDGRAESFASLMNMLDPTAIADPSNYDDEDFREKGLVIRRFKKDVASQLQENFPERDIHTVHVPASPAEEALYAALAAAEFNTLRGGGGQLFRTTLEKILLSSPAALCSTLQKRIANLQNRLEGASAPKDPSGIHQDLETLEHLLTLAEQIKPEDFSKFQRLVDMLSPTGEHSEGWDSDAKDDRMVVFTESLQTLDFLMKHLPRALKLNKAQVQELHGSMKDTDVAKAVEDFNRGDAPVRLLICTDAASEGINLHHLSHRMIHFDIPWSLMVFQQRNGRIDRYGQNKQPKIRYLQIDSQVERMQGDARILDILIEKDKQASANIGDPSEFMGGASEEEQEEITAKAIEANAPDDFEAFLATMGQASTDSVEQFVGVNQTSSDLAELTGTLPRLFPDDDSYMRAALEWLSETKVVRDYEVAQDEYLRFSPPQDLRARMRYLPKEAIPKEDGRFVLTANKDSIAHAMRKARDQDLGWPDVHYLWRLHPAVEWAGDRALNAFGRHSAPLLELARLPAGHAWVLAHGGFPNRRGQFVIQDWHAFRFDADGALKDKLSIEEFLAQVPLNDLVNRGVELDPEPFQKLLAPATNAMRDILKRKRAEFEAHSDASSSRRMTEHEKLKQRHLDVLQDKLKDLPERIKEERLKDGIAKVNANFDNYLDWLENTQITETKPYIQIAAVLVGVSQ